MKHYQFLEARIANAKKNLAEPNVIYPNGRMSHEVNREVLCEAEQELWELRIGGYFYADGTFAGYAEEED